MALDKNDIDALAQALKKAFSGSSFSQGPSRRGDDGYDDQVKATATLTKKSKQAAKQLEDLGDNVGDLSSAVQELLETASTQAKIGKETGVVNEKYAEVVKSTSAALLKSNSKFHKITDEYDSLSRKTLPEQRKYMQKFSKVNNDLSSKMAQNIRTSSILGASMLEAHKYIDEGSHQYHTMLDSLTAASKPLNKGLLRAAGVLDKSSDTIKDGLNPSDFAQLRLAIGEVETTIREDLGKLGYKDFSQVLKKSAGDLAGTFSGESGARLKAGVIALATKLEHQGVDLGLSQKLTETKNGKTVVNAQAVTNLGKDPAEMQKLIKNLHGLSTENMSAINSMNREALMSSSKLHSMAGNISHTITSLGSLQGAIELLEANLASDALIKNGFDKAKEAIISLYKSVQSFNIAGVPEGFMEVQKASISMGMSFEDTVKFMQENKRAMALYGDSFSSYTGQLKGTFQKFGYTMSQASAILAPATEAAAASGINVRDAKAMNNFIDQNMQSFNNLHGMVDITAEEFFKLQASLLQDRNVRDTLIGMSKQQAQSYVKEMTAQRENYVQLGLSTEQANELLKEQQAAARAPVVQRLKEGAMTMLAAQQAGLSPEEARRAYDIKMKGRNATQEEQTELSNTYQKIGVAQEKQVAGASGGQQLSIEVMQEKLNAGMGASAEQQMETGKQIATQERSGNQVTDAEKKKQAEAAAGKESVAAVGNTVNSVVQLLNNDFSKAILGATAALLGLAIQAFLTSGSLGGKGGGLGNLLNAFKKGGGALAAEAGAGVEAVAGAEAAAPAAAEGGGMLSKLLGGAGKGGGLLGKGLGSAGNIASKAAVPLAIAGSLFEGITGWMGVDQQQKAGKLTEKQANMQRGKVVGSTAGGLAGGIGGAEGGALAGAALGSVVPVVGTAVGGLIGGALGGVAGYFGGNLLGGLVGGEVGKHVPTSKAVMAHPALAKSASISATQSSQEQTNQAVNNTGSNQAPPEPKVPGATLVEDEAGNTYLAQIADSLVQAVKLLQVMADNGNPQALAALNNARTMNRPIPTANGYITGRQPAR